MPKYPQILLPEMYIRALLLGKAKHKLDEEAVILCDYCLEQFKTETNPQQFYAGGWLTDERCPIHRHYWLKLWFLV